MRTRYDNAFGRWLKTTMEEHGIKSSRGFISRGIDVAHTTIETILQGRQPSVQSAMKIAFAFHLPIPDALHMAGYPDLAAMWSPASSDSLAVGNQARDAEDIPAELQRVYQAQRQVYADLPQGVRQRFLESLLSNTELLGALISTRSDE
jgi:hypothetical protein